MKYLIAGCSAVLMAVLGAVVGVNQWQKDLCDTWLIDAKVQAQRGLFSTSSDTLTLYFSSKTCRSAKDAKALHLLAHVQGKIPAPQNIHLVQQINLSQLGLQLGQDKSAYLAQASAHLAHGNWDKADQSAKRAEGPQAALISLAVSIALQDEVAIAASLKAFRESDPTPFSQALIRSLRRLSGVLKESSSHRYLHGLQLEKINQESAVEILAGFVADPSKYSISLEFAGALAANMSLKDISVASSLLATKGELRIAVTLLDQPKRAMTPVLIKRLGKLLWLSGKLYLLDTVFLNRQTLGVMPAEAFFVVCAAELSLTQRCEFRFASADYKKRHGAYAAGRWHTLLSLMAEPKLNAPALIDALNAMTSLLKGNAIALHFKAQLLNSIGEQVLAVKYGRMAEALGFGDAPSMVLFTTDNLQVCNDNKLDCFAERLKKQPGHFALWRRALQEGFKADLNLAVLLREASPKEAILWRSVLAQSLISTGTDESVAEALVIVRPVLNWAPHHAVPRLLAATAYAHFGDSQATFIELAATVEFNPNRAVETLRLAYGFYKRGKMVTADQLVHWWHAVTLLEIKARNIGVLSPEAIALLDQRLSLLAAIAEQKQDDALLMVAYGWLLQANTQNHMALNNLAFHLAQKGQRLEHALALSEQAVLLFPNHPEYRNTLRFVQDTIEKKQDVKTVG